ncbi:MAG: hypothetical protein Ta2A_12740 [Treponemataceae bacterium]|nr:MAG: hypothetical protein Ta2A_12740 [Treponemataceae bacterium]
MTQSDELHFFPEKAPNCRSCFYYCQNFGGWVEAAWFDTETGAQLTDWHTEYGDYSVGATFSHGCRKFKFTAPSHKMPSTIVYESTKRHCPIVSKTAKRTTSTKQEYEILEEDHIVDISV